MLCKQPTPSYLSGSYDAAIASVKGNQTRKILPTPSVDWKDIVLALSQAETWERGETQRRHKINIQEYEGVKRYS
ncbi:MAG: hypothetical protein GDA56_05010 [Hormoscilla sp. GM7CHS1pb]|nr:hypothetical protein [Hormoscilla sp. GM7CHS1pb]